MVMALQWLIHPSVGDSGQVGKIVPTSPGILTPIPVVRRQLLNIEYQAVSVRIGLVLSAQGEPIQFFIIR